MKTYLVCALLACSLPMAIGQNTKKEERLAKLYQNKGYGKYVEEQAKGNIGTLPLEDLIRVADSYRKVGNTYLTEYLYGVVVAQKDEPIYRLYYAQALQANEKYAEAKTEYLLYDKAINANSPAKPDNRGKVLADACARIAQFQTIGEVDIYNEQKLNGEGLDFSPNYYKNGLIFVSTRGRQSPTNVDKWINDKFMDLYYSEIGADGMAEEPKAFSNDLNSRYHEGPVSFMNNQQRIYFTRNNYLHGKRGKSKDKITKLKIYSARLINNRWLDVREFPYNSTEYDVCHPAISADGRMMVFSADAQDSKGGQDLYVSYWRGNAWTRPMNLGSEINTAGNETFPYLHSDGTLFYASDGLGGLGGLDIFMATKVNGGMDSLWVAPYNLGAPFNTKYDDFGLIINKAQNEGYLSSNRDGGIGKDDIYHFKIQNKKIQETIPTESKEIQIAVYDKLTNKRLENAKVFVRTPQAKGGKNPTANGLNPNNGLVLKLSPSSEGDNQYLLKIENDNPNGNNPNGTNPNEPQGEPLYTDETGTVPYPIAARQPYVVDIVRDGYAPITETITLPSLDGLEEYGVGLDPLNPNGNNPNAANNPNKAPLFEKIHPQGTAYDPNYSPSDFTPVNPRLAGKVINKEYNRPLPTAIVTLLNRCTGEEETIKLKKDGTFDLTLECGCDYVLKTRKDNFQSLNKVIALSNPENCKKPIAALLAMNPNIDKTGNAVVALGGNTLYEGLKEGDIIELKNIFYNFDEYNIRPDASKDLDELAHIMGQLPSMEIELSSHTDARASDSYNNTLSNNRAKSAKAYLVAKGISESRIKAIGYGENRPKNNCRDGVECSEYEHQRNRRTEVFVTKFNPTEVIKIQYIDNTPTVVDPMR